jgi:hypothetical protein
MEKTMPKAGSAKMPNTQFAHIEIKINIASDLASDFTRKSTGFVMGALTNFYKLLSETREPKDRRVLEGWLEQQLEIGMKELSSVKAKIETVKDELADNRYQLLTYPRTQAVSIVCSHPASFAVIEMFENLDEIGKVTDGLWMTRKIHRKQKDQIAQEARRAITKMIDGVIKFTAQSKGRNKPEVAASQSDQKSTESENAADVMEKPASKAKPIKKKTPNASSIKKTAEVENTAEASV